jgi:hypothetical protein
MQVYKLADASHALQELVDSITGNVTLSYLSRAYGLPEKVKLGRGDEANGIRQSQKLAADTFEAYIGVLWKDILDTEPSDPSRVLNGRAADALPKSSSCSRTSRHSSAQQSSLR